MGRIKFIILVLTLSLFCCSDNPNSDEQNYFDLGKKFSINFGETLYHNTVNLSIKFDSLIGDSRCPVDVVCVWEGDAEIKLKFSANSIYNDFTLHTNKAYFNANTTLLDYKIELLDLLPYPNTEIQHLITQYEAEIVISPQ